MGWPDLFECLQKHKMAYLLEKRNGSRCVLEAVKRELFTQKKFADMISEAHSRSQDYYLARVQCRGGGAEPWQAP